MHQLVATRIGHCLLSLSTRVIEDLTAALQNTREGDSVVLAATMLRILTIWSVSLKSHAKRRA